MFPGLESFVQGLDVVWQWLGVMLVSAIPFVESYGGSMIGVIVGVPVFLAIPSAIIGNIVSMLIFVLSAGKVRDTAMKNKEHEEETPRQKRIRKLFDKYGVPGVSLLGQTFLPSQITSAAMVGFGATRQKVIFWQILSIILWGIAFGLLAHYGLNALVNM